MKVFAIRDEYDKTNKNLAYLIYYEKAKRFYIELPEDSDPWDVPIILSSFVKEGQYTVNSYWSKIWVQQRIVPSDRQNIGQILRDNGLKTYDEYELLMLSQGRCEQDDCFLIPLKETELPDDFKKRYAKKIEYVVPLESYKLIVFFRDGKTKVFTAKKQFESIIKHNRRYADKTVFNQVKIMPGGYGLTWGSVINITDEQIYEAGKTIPLGIDDFTSFVQQAVVSSTEAADILNCSRQNIDDLIRRDKLHPIKIYGKNKLFLRDEILQREWE